MCSRLCVAICGSKNTFTLYRQKNMSFIFHFDFCFWLSLYINAFKWLLNHWSTPLRKTIHAYVLELDLAKYLFLWLPILMKQGMIKT